MVELIEDKLIVLDSSFNAVNLTESERKQLIEIIKNPANKER